MTGEIERHVYDDRTEVVLDGEVILIQTGTRKWPPTDEADDLFNEAEAILEDANIGSPQREAFIKVLAIQRAIVGNIPVIDHRDHS